MIQPCLSFVLHLCHGPGSKDEFPRNRDVKAAPPSEAPQAPKHTTQALQAKGRGARSGSEGGGGSRTNEAKNPHLIPYHLPSTLPLHPTPHRGHPILKLPAAAFSPRGFLTNYALPPLSFDL
jgi:hypothetical protein